MSDGYRRYEPHELRRFLEAVDSHLTSPITITVIGGSAATLAYGFPRPTQDVDTFESNVSALKSAIALAQADTGLQIPLGNAGVADLPYSYADRVQRALPELKNLAVLVPEIHDLVLSKMVRGEVHDLEAATYLHASQGLDFETLVSRFHSEMDHVTKAPAELWLTFIVWIEALFGKPRAVEAARRIPKPPR